MSFNLKYRPWTLNDFAGGVSASEVRRLLDSRTPIALIAPYGFGKTSLAILIMAASSCLDPNQENRPCGQCDNCLNLRRHFESNCYGGLDFIKTPATGATTLLDMNLTTKEIIYEWGCLEDRVHLRVVVFDEFQECSYQRIFLKRLEVPGKYTSFVFCIPQDKLHQISEPLLQRMALVELTKPSTSALLPLVKRVTDGEEILVLEPTAPQHLVEVCNNTPRLILNGLEKLKGRSAGLSRDAVDEIIRPMMNAYSLVKKTKPH
jgi:hypothetical protein